MKKLKIFESNSPIFNSTKIGELDKKFNSLNKKLKKFTDELGELQNYGTQFGSDKAPLRTEREINDDIEKIENELNIVSMELERLGDLNPYDTYQKVFEQEFTLPKYNMLEYLDSDEYKQLTPLKQKMVYSYIMVKMDKMTIDDIKTKFGVTDGVAKGWVKYGEDFYV